MQDEETWKRSTGCPRRRGGGAECGHRRATLARNAAYIRVRTYIFLPIFLLLPSLFGQGGSICDLVKQGEADALLGGSSKQLPVGNMGCGYSIRATGVRLTLTVQDMGTSAKAVWDGMKDQVKRANWLVGDEAGMGSNAYAQLIKRSADSSAGKSGFVVVKGSKVLQIFVTDDAEKADIAGKKDMLDKLRPLALKAVQRM